MNKNDMALCTVGGTTFQKEREKCRRMWKMFRVQNAKTKRKCCMCECLYVK